MTPEPITPVRSVMLTKRLLLCLLAVMLAAFVGCSEPAKDINPHPAGWVEAHQARLRATGYNFTSCGECHGADLSGAETAEGCSGGTCHHDNQWWLTHQVRMRTSNYDFDACRVCHGQDLGGGALAEGCRREFCHTADKGPLACDNCHGYLTTEPFENLAGDTAVTVLTVGVHTSHYTGAHDLTSNVTCASCHVVPDSVLAEGHIDTSAHAEVTFGSLGDVAAVGTESSWDRDEGTCSDIYCHGNFTYSFASGIDSSWTWTEPATGDLCGTCHGLPPEGHSADWTDCGQCHGSVVSSADHRTIIGLENHINGLKNRP